MVELARNLFSWLFINSKFLLLWSFWSDTKLIGTNRPDFSWSLLRPGLPLNVSALLTNTIWWGFYSISKSISASAWYASFTILSLVMSNTNINALAFVISARARSIPSLSIRSSECLIPAVSVRINYYPPIITCVEIRSRVVPAIGLVIETLLSASKFIKVDFPAFGGPNITTFYPSLTASPTSLF